MPSTKKIMPRPKLNSIVQVSNKSDNTNAANKAKKKNKICSSKSYLA